MCISDIYIIPCQSTASICTNNIIQSSETSKKTKKKKLGFLTQHHHSQLKIQPQEKQLC